MKVTLLLGVIGLATIALAETKDTLEDERAEVDREINYRRDTMGCTKTEKECKAMHSSLPECPREKTEENRAQFYNKTECCSACKPATPIVVDSCTKDMYKRCVESLDDCAVDRKPLRVQGSCCASCKFKPKKSIRELIKCRMMKSTPKCGKGERPKLGDCAGSCRRKYKKSNCTEPCADKKMCFWKWTNKTADEGQSVCRNPSACRTYVFKLKADIIKTKVDEVKKEIKDIGREALTRLIADLVASICETNEKLANRSVCLNLENFIDRFNVEILGARMEKVRFKLCVKPKETERRMLTADDDDITEILDLATTSGDAEISIEIETTNNEGGEKTSGASAVAPAIGLGLAVMMTF